MSSPTVDPSVSSFTSGIGEFALAASNRSCASARSAGDALGSALTSSKFLLALLNSVNAFFSSGFNLRVFSESAAPTSDGGNVVCPSPFARLIPFLSDGLKWSKDALPPSCCIIAPTNFSVIAGFADRSISWSGLTPNFLATAFTYAVVLFSLGGAHLLIISRTDLLL